MKRYFFLILVGTIFFLQSGTLQSVSAQAPSPAPSAPANITTPSGAPATAPATNTQPASGVWNVDSEVTFIGKNAARAGLMLDWTLQNYNWVCVNKVDKGICDNNKNPLQKYWLQIVQSIVIPLAIIIILVTAAVIIGTRGKSLTIMRFIPRFIIITVLIVLSYPMMQFFNQFADFIQGVFLQRFDQRCPPDCISQVDLLFVGWKYQDFIGLRLSGDANAESAFISLLLTKLTALTYYVMIGILLMRKIILWFFLIVSPIFPILLLYYPTRNTAKIWVGEFSRWLLYAPLFAIFLKGLVTLWRDKIPLWFSSPYVQNADQIIYPTAVNIMLGGPKQVVSQTNSINLTETFSLYVVALIMLWIVILLPWILLQIFLDYASNFSAGDSTAMKTLINMATVNKQPIIPGVNSPPSGPGTGPAKGGEAISLPFAKKYTIPTDLKPSGAAKELLRGALAAKPTQAAFTPTAQQKAQVLSMANMPLPSMRDIAKYETALISRDKGKQQEVSQLKETLQKIGNPAQSTSTTDRQNFVGIQQKLMQESQRGNSLATSILSAANSTSKTNMQSLRSTLQQVANPASIPNVTEREKFTKIHEVLQKESSTNQLAASILQVSDSTSVKDLQTIRDNLMQTKSDSSLSEVKNAVQASETTSNVKAVLEQVAHPESATTPGEQQRLVKLKDTLSKASQQGNQLATSLLSVTNTTSKEDIEKLNERILEAKAKGEPLANEIAAITQTTAVVPNVNRVQTVNKEDYEAVRALWKDNYKNLEVPEGMAGTRQEWLKEDIANIDKILALLTTNDDAKVNEGLNEVSNILPFLMVGGFSKTEIVSYLQAKQEAAKQTLQELSQEEEDKVSVSTQKATTQRTMSATMEESTTPAASGASSNSDLEEEESPLSATSLSTATATPSKFSDEILAMANLKRPTLRDIVRYETRSMIQDKAKVEDVEKMHAALEQIANPAGVADAVERAKVEQLKEKLSAENQKGNVTAGSILSAAVTSVKQEGLPENVSLPSVNTAEPVKDDEYEALKKMWEENYRNLPVPAPFTQDSRGRMDWIGQDVKDIEETVGLLQSSEQEKKKQGEKKLGAILPFLVLGGFSVNEMMKYLQVKIEAAKTVLGSLQAEEEKQLSAAAVQQTNDQQKAMTASEEEKKG